MISFSTPKFEAAITRFKGHFVGHPQLFAFGQFYVMNRTFDDLIAANQNALLLPSLPAASFISFLRTALDQPAHSIDLNAIKLKLDALKALGINVSAIRVLLTPGNPDVANAQSDYNKDLVHR